MKIIFIIFILFFGLNSCGLKEEQSTSQIQDVVKIDWKLEEKLQIDEETSITNPINIPVYIGNDPKLLIFTNISNSLKLYDIKSKNLETSILFPKQGPNSIQGIEISSGINFVNRDTVILVSPSYKTIYLANFAGEVYRNYDFIDFEYGLGSINLTTPLAYRKGSIYIQALPLSTVVQEFSDPRIIKIDLSSGEIEFLKFDFPVSQQNYSPKLKMLDILYYEKIDKFLISFPFMDSIYVTDFKSSPKMVSMKSELVEYFEPLNMEDQTVPKEQRISYFDWISDSYGKLIYDPVNDFFIREARRRITSEDFISRKLYPEKELLVFDSDFRFKERIKHDGSGIYYYFFGQDKLFINKDLRKFNLEASIEDTIFFQGIEY